MTATTMERAEIKARAPRAVKEEAAAIYARWGITLNDAINMFLAKTIEVGGLPFALRPEAPSYESLSKVAYKPSIDDAGIAVLPASWDDDDE